MEQQNKKRNMTNLLYGVIGVATLMLATIGATFAYYTATQSNDNQIKGDMATIEFDVSVTKATTADNNVGLIPMSNNMVEQALIGTDTNSDSTKEICIDINGNPVCQVYKITVNNTSTASMFVDGYVTLSGGSGNPADIGPTVSGGKGLYTADQLSGKTTMRWAQAFCKSGTDNIVTECTTAGSSTVRSTATVSMSQLGVSPTAKADGFNVDEILSQRAEVTGNTSINGNSYEVINKNYIRVSSPHTYGVTAYTRANDTTSALVYSQYLDALDDKTTNDAGDSYDANLTTSGTNDAYVDSQVYYIVVWLGENGHNQTVNQPTGNNTTANASTSLTNFFQGNVTFVSAQGSEVTATFAGHLKVTPNT